MKPAPPENSIKIRIANEEYYVTCSEQEQIGLLKAAHMLDSEIRSRQQSDRSMSAERGAVMVALNMADELLALRESKDAGDTEPRIKAISEKIDQTLRKFV